MRFVILRQLQHSELGMFHSYRRSGLERSRQRAINFDGAVVDRVFPAAIDTDRIELNLAYDTDNGLREAPHFLKRQAKNWRLEGNCPSDFLYDFIQPGCLFAMYVDSSSTRASGGWIVFPKGDVQALAILSDGATSQLARAGMIALESDEAPLVHEALAAVRPDIFSSNAKALPMANDDPLPNDAPLATQPRRRLAPGPERLAEMLGASGHNLISAVADIVDNAISAGATEVRIAFEPPTDGRGRWMAIRDNGKGMSAQVLDEAMRIGGAPNYEARSLGKYGFGLKGASWSQARAFRVVTREQGGGVISLGWDQNNMADWEVDDSPLDPWELQTTDPGEHGTVVLWKDMKASTSSPAIKGVSPYVAEVQELSRHLGLVFHRFLDGEAKGRAPLKILINNVSVESNGPASHVLTTRYDQKTVKVPFGKTQGDVRVEPIVLPSEDELRAHHGATWQSAADKIGYWGKRNDTQGLFLYRNDRLIRWGGWHDMWATNDEKTKLARVLIDFDPALDEAFQINISKQTVRLPGYLQTQIKPLADAARKASQAKFKRPRPSPQPSPAPSTTATTVVPVSPGPILPGNGEGFSDPSPTQLAPSSPPAPQPIAVRKVTTAKFAWKFATGLTGEKSLQIGDLAPGLADLASAIANNAPASEALALFLEELDRLDVQQSLVEEASSP